MNIRKSSFIFSLLCVFATAALFSTSLLATKEKPIVIDDDPMVVEKGTPGTVVNNPIEISDDSMDDESSDESSLTDSWHKEAFVKLHQKTIGGGLAPNLGSGGHNVAMIGLQRGETVIQNPTVNSQDIIFISAGQSQKLSGTLGVQTIFAYLTPGSWQPATNEDWINKLRTFLEKDLGIVDEGKLTELYYKFRGKFDVSNFRNSFKNVNSFKSGFFSHTEEAIFLYLFYNSTIFTNETPITLHIASMEDPCPICNVLLQLLVERYPHITVKFSGVLPKNRKQGGMQLITYQKGKSPTKEIIFTGEMIEGLTR
jgi:hypothetical protein